MSETEQKYDVLEKIGHGSFGVIRKVRRRDDGMVLCRKEISYLKMSQKEREQLHAEFQILSTLRHPNIVGYYHREHLKATQDLHLYMEYCGNGDLGRVIRDLSQKNQYAEESFVWSIFAQLVTALYRCHYGVDPPEVGKNVLGLGNAARPKVPAGGVMILHRDLKPENVFLGEDNSVKLGDFGLAKMIQSHDFASTYVGTPFYMSPEICAAEKYTLKSDIWSLGCIMYELCAREPPFNAKSHYQLVQKIKEGKLAPLPVVYSPELCAVVRDCLKVNPDRRPDTATLLNLPVVRLMRKEKEVVELGRVLRAKEDQLARRSRELERKLEADRQHVRQQVDASMRREWEVKARLEIDRLVSAELERLQKKFEAEVQQRVDAEVQEAQQHMAAAAAAAAADRRRQQKQQQQQELSSSMTKSEYAMHSSVGDNDAANLTDLTDLTELSIDESGSTGGASVVAAPVPPLAPVTSAAAFLKRAAPQPQTRTPFARAQTMFAGTPMDVEMASPSPMAIASLSLSPRRQAAAKAPTNGSIFGADDARWTGARDPPALDWDSDDDAAGIPSPTRLIRARKNLFVGGLARPRCKGLGLGLESSGNSMPNVAATSPGRRLSNIPSAANLGNAAPTSTDEGHVLTHKPSFQRGETAATAMVQPVGLVSKQKPGIRGRTLVELQQARAGGRPLSMVEGSGIHDSSNSSSGQISPKRPFREHANAANRGSGLASESPAVWDPEQDEMPSPFLVRRKTVMGR